VQHLAGARDPERDYAGCRSPGTGMGLKHAPFRDRFRGDLAGSLQAVKTSTPPAGSRSSSPGRADRSKDRYQLISFFDWFIRTPGKRRFTGQIFDCRIMYRNFNVRPFGRVFYDSLVILRKRFERSENPSGSSPAIPCLTQRMVQRNLINPPPNHSIRMTANKILFYCP